jgi:hypothetical protein
MLIRNAAPSVWEFKARMTPLIACLQIAVSTCAIGPDLGVWAAVTFRE